MSTSHKTIILEEKGIFWSMTFVVFVLLGLYLYFVSTSVINVLMREEYAASISKLHSEISIIETQYVNQRVSINMALAEELGFHEVKNSHFVIRSAGSLTLRE